MIRLSKPRISSFPGDRIYEAVASRVGTDPRVLAVPPPGSDLKPVLGETGLPVVGKSIEFVRKGSTMADPYVAKYGSVFWTKTFGRPTVWVASPEAAKEVLTSKAKMYSQTGWQFFIDAFFHRGLMLLDDQEHLMHRRIMQEAFTRARLAEYTEQFVGLIEREVTRWPHDAEMLFNPAIKDLSLGVATEVFMGADPRHSGHLTQSFVDAVRGGTAIVRTEIPGASFLRWNKGLAGRKVLEAHFRREIPAKRASGDRDLFTALCHAQTESGEQFSDDDIVAHMIFLMMAAHDTATITTTASAYYLATFPELQDLAREQSERFRGEAVTLEVLDQLTVIDSIFQEAMRLVAPVPGLMRETTEDTDITGYFVPKGTLVSVIPDSVHRSLDAWTNPHEFDIGRYAPDREEHKSHRFAHIPFGGGAHKCIGMVFGSAEVKTMLHTVLLHHRLEVPPDYELMWDRSSLVVPCDGFPVTLRDLGPR